MQSVEYRLLAPYQLALEEISIEWPPKKAPKILCKTKYSGISPGTEVAAWSGQKRLRPSGGYPRKVGYQNISEIIEISEEVQGFNVGDLIYTNQGHISRFSCDPAEILAVLPSDYEVKKYLFAYMYHLGLCALSTGANFQEMKSNISIFGGGVLGVAVAELAEYLGFSSTLVTDVEKNSSLNKIRCTSVSRENFRTNYLRSDTEFQQCIVTTNSWDDYNLGLSTLGHRGSMTLLGFPGRDGALPITNPFSPELFYVNNLSIFSTPSLRNDLFNSRNETLSLGDSITEIVSRISNGELGHTFDDVEIYSYLELATLYGDIEFRRITAPTAGIDWSIV